MAETKHPAKLAYRFGHFEAVPETGELYRQGQRVKIQDLPFRVLIALLQQQGQIVSRDLLARQLWPEKTFVEFDQGLSTAVTKLRQAIGDMAENPRFVETVPRRGYRFIAPVSVEGLQPDAAEQPAPSGFIGDATGSEPQAVSPVSARQRLPGLWKWTAAVAVLVLAGLCVFLFRAPFRARASLRANDRVVLTDFDNATGNPQFDDTLNSALRVKLDESPYFNLVPAKAVEAALEQVASLPSSPGSTNHAASGPLSPGHLSSHFSLNDAQQICQAVHAQAIVHGSVARAGDGLRLRLQADRCGAAGKLAEEEAVSPSPDLLLTSLGVTADALRRVLGEPESSVQQFGTPIVQATSASFSALKAFAAGEEKRVRGQDHETIADYKLATDLDPEFALAYARLGTIYSNESEARLSAAAYQKAFDLRMHTTERERLYLTAHYYGSSLGDIERALGVYQLWRQLYPQDLIAPNNLADLYETAGQPEQARLMAREALRINPDNAFPYAGLLQADQRLGRYEEARAVWKDATARKLDNSVIARMAMFRIGMAQADDALVRQQLAWAAGNPREGELLMLAGWAKAASGHLREAQTLFHGAQEAALRNGLKEFAADAGEDLAQFECDFGKTAQARAEVAHSLALAPAELNVDAFAALILAGTGDRQQAGALVQKVQAAAPQNTIFVKMILPMAQSRLNLQSGDPEKAVEQLRSVAVFDLSRVTELASIFYRAQALLAAHRGPEAEKEFQRVVDLRAICPISPYLALSHLGLARSRRLMKDEAGARAEYATFLQQWKDADPDLPVLRQARAESRF